jgi:hypothetical protein
LSSPSPELRRLLETKLDTYEKLELVVVLCKRVNMEGQAQDLARELQVGDDVLKRFAAEVARTGLVEIDDERIRLIAQPHELVTIGEGAKLLESDPRRLMSLLSSIALDRIRGMAARSFADAFTLRKKKDNGDG